MSQQRKITLQESEIPTHWYNIVADMPNKPLPPLHPATQQPIGPEALAPLFPMELIKQEVTAEKWVEIPGEVRNLYSIWRPTPMYRALGLEKALGTKSKIYYIFNCDKIKNDKVFSFQEFHFKSNTYSYPTLYSYSKIRFYWTASKLHTS